MNPSFIMHAFRSRSTRFAVLLSLVLLSILFAAQGQTTPSLQGTSVPDPAVPVVITPAPAGSGFFVLNGDYSLLQHSTADTSQNESCSAPPVFSQTNTSQRTLVTDLYNAYIGGPDAPQQNVAVTAVTPEVLCQMTTPFDYTGGLPARSIAANDIEHASYYLLSAFGGGEVDLLTALDNLNNGSVSSSNKFSQQTSLSLDIGGVYTSVVPDVRGLFGLVAITELKTDTSPGNLYIYYPQTKTAFKILGPGGVPLPAVTSFIIPAQTDGGGDLLVLVNQDGLNASNINNPPQDTTPLTIIDLGQLRPIFASNPAGNTITLPFVQQVTANSVFYAMLGGAYNPLDHRVYVPVGGGSASGQTASILSYDTLHLAAPAEVVVADVTNVPFSFGSYPQIALNAASGTMQILTSSPSSVYSVGINGTGNTAVPVTGSTFTDSNFQPTYIAANPLQGETYIASAGGQVDILTRPATTQGGLTITLTGSDLGYTSQPYELKALALWPVYDSSLGTAKLTITVTPSGGTPTVLATGSVADIGYPGDSFYSYTFPAAGQYTIVATADASANYPAVSSPPLNVFVGNTGVYPTTTALSLPSTIAASNGVASLNASVTLTGTTYAPTGAVYLQDPTGAEVGNIQLPAGVISNPITVPITLNEGVQTLTAVYQGDEQNQSSASAPQTITVGAVARVTPTFALTLPANAAPSSNVTGTLATSSSSKTPPTGTIAIYATLSGSTTSNQIASVDAAKSFAAGGASFTFTSPSAGSYTVFAGYGGDTNYTNGVSPSVPFVVGAPLQTTTVSIAAPATATAGTAFNTNVGFKVSGSFTTPPTGNIVLTASSANSAAIALGTVTAAQAMASGGANISASLPNPGAYTLTAAYAGDAGFGASSNSAALTVTPPSLQTTTVGIVAPATASAGTLFNVVIGFNVFGPFTTQPTGNIVLTETPAGGNPSIVGTVTPAQGMAPGGANISVALPNAGVYTLTATYAGDSLYDKSSNTAGVTVKGYVTSLTVSAGANQSTATAFNATVLLSTGGSTSTPVDNVVLTANLPGGPLIVLATVSAAQASAPGGKVIPVTLGASGTYTLTASYPGGGPLLASTGTATVTVTQPVIPTSLVFNPPLAVTVGTAFPVGLGLVPKTSSTVAPSGSIVITGTIGGVTRTYDTVSAAQAFGSGGVSVQVTVAAPGTYSFNASYAGDANYGASNATATVVASALPPPAFQLIGLGVGQVAVPMTYSVNIFNAKGTANALATITSTINGQPGPSATAMGPNGSFTLTFPTAGTYVVVGQYPGDALNGPATSNTITTQIYTPGSFPTFTVKPKDASLNAGSTPIAIPSDSDATVPLIVTPVNGFSGSLDLTASAVLQNVTLFTANDSPPDIRFLDANGHEIGFLSASLYVAPPSTNFGVLIRGGNRQGALVPFSPVHAKNAPVVCLLFCIFTVGCLRTRGRLLRHMRLLCAVLMLGTLGGLLTGCGYSNEVFLVTVTAHSYDNGTTQTVTFPIKFPKQ